MKFCEYLFVAIILFVISYLSFVLALAAYDFGLSRVYMHAAKVYDSDLTDEDVDMN